MMMLTAVVSFKKINPIITQGLRFIITQSAAQQSAVRYPTAAAV
jgi:hypothetical protein